MKKKVFLFLLLLLMAVGLVACDNSSNSTSRNERESSGSKKDKDDDDDDDDDNDDDKPVEVVQSDYNKCAMMVYIVGSNLESQGGLATMDIEEMIAGDYDEELMDIYLCTGGASKWYTKEIDEDEIAVFKLVDDELEKLDTINTKTMASTNTLQSFINIAYEDTDADCYNLVLWNHGAGAVVGFGADETAYFQAMTMPEVATAIGGSNLVKTGHKFEVIGFDACLMGMIEVATTLDDYANYLVASEEIIPGMGWDYTCFGQITESGDFRGENVGQIIIDSYAKFYKEQTKFHSEYALSCLDLSRTGNVVESIDLLVSDGIDELTSGDYSIIARARSKTKAFGRIGGETFYDTIDLYNLAENFAEEYPDSTAAVMNSIDEMVVYHKSNIQRTHGVAIYFPYDNKMYVDDWLEDYQDLEFSENYKIFLDGYVTVLNGESIADWDIGNVVAQQNANIKSQYSIQLTPEQAETYAKCRVSVWEKDEDKHDLYLCRMTSSDAELYDGGNLVANFNDEIFYLSNDAGDEISFSLFEVDRNSDYVLYEGDLFVEREVGYLDYEYYTVIVTVRVDDQHPDGEIVSFTTEEDIQDTNLFPQVTLFEFEDGDSMSGYILNRQVKFDSNGNLAPFDEWDTPYIYTSEYMIYDGALSCEFKPDEELEEGSYFCLFTVTNTQGDVFYSGPFLPEDRLTDGIYITYPADPSFTQDEPMDVTTGQAALFDEFGEQIVVISSPDNFDIREKDSWPPLYITYKEKNEKGKYFNEVKFDRDASKHYTEYLNYGTLPDASQYPDFKCEYNTYSAGNYDIMVVSGNDFYGGGSRYDEIFVLIPYLDCYGDKHYLRIDGEKFDEMSDDEIVEFVKQFIQ